jgi:hypothetical protein
VLLTIVLTVLVALGAFELARTIRDMEQTRVAQWSMGEVQTLLQALATIESLGFYIVVYANDLVRYGRGDELHLGFSRQRDDANIRRRVEFIHHHCQRKVARY